MNFTSVNLLMVVMASCCQAQSIPRILQNKVFCYFFIYQKLEQSDKAMQCVSKAFLTPSLKLPVLATFCCSVFRLNNESLPPTVQSVGVEHKSQGIEQNMLLFLSF